MNSYMTQEELENSNLNILGKNVFISRKVSIYNAKEINIGNNVRIDDFCILSGKITINNYVHIAAYTALFGGTQGIVIEDFANISSRVCVYAVSDDFSGETMTNPMIPDKYKNLINLPVLIQKHSLIGTGSTILPGVTIREGCSFGAMSLITKTTEPWGIYAGIPVKRIKERKKNLLKLEKEFLNEKI